MGHPGHCTHRLVQLRAITPTQGTDEQSQVSCLLSPADLANLGKNLFPIKICRCQQLFSTLLEIPELLSLQQAFHFYGDAPPCSLNVPHQRMFPLPRLLPGMTLCFQLPLHHILIRAQSLACPQLHPLLRALPPGATSPSVYQTRAVGDREGGR